MRNSTSENVAEHSYVVAMLSHAIATIGVKIFGKTYNPDKIAVYAIYHDISEVITGDLPTPVKYANPKLENAYKELENSALDRLLSMLPTELVQDFDSAMRPNDSESLLIVKAADKIAAYIKCIEEHKVGNSEFFKAYKANQNKVNALNQPEVKYFVKHFLSAYELSLDEISK